MRKNILLSKIAEKGLNQKELAAHINMSRSAFSKRINGKTPFSVDEIKKIQAALNLHDTEMCSIFF